MLSQLNLSATSEKLAFSEQLAQITNKGDESPKEDEEENKTALMQVDMNPYDHDNKTFIVFPDYQNTVNATWSSADILAKKSRHHQVRVFYHGSIQTQLFDFLRSRFSFLPKRDPARYGFDVEEAKAAVLDTQRTCLLKHLHQVKPKFIVIGVQGGLSASLLGHEKDVSFRQCIGATPIICKEKNVFNKKGHPPTEYDNVTYAFQVDFSNEAMHAFKMMVDHFDNGDTVHLIWVKPDEGSFNFQRQSVNAINFAFQPFKRIIQDLKLNIKCESLILNGPNVGEALVSFANDKENCVDFLITYCDLMGDYIKGKEIIGSVSDYCVRHSQCAVIVPKLPTN